MSSQENKRIVLRFMERAFNQGDLSAVDEAIAPAGVDHQEAEGVNFNSHLRQVITGLRTAFPDLNFEIHEAVAEGDVVAFRSTMTGTHTGPLQLGPSPVMAPTGRKIAVDHMHFVHLLAGQCRDLWHMWDTAAMMQQLNGVAPISGHARV